MAHYSATQNIKQFLTNSPQSSWGEPLLHTCLPGLIADWLKILLGEVLVGAFSADRCLVQLVLGVENPKGGVHTEPHAPPDPFSSRYHQSRKVRNRCNTRVKRYPSSWVAVDMTVLSPSPISPPRADDSLTIASSFSSFARAMSNRRE